MSGAHTLRGSLAVRIVLPIAIALVLVFALGSFYLGRTVQEEGRRELVERARLLADTLAYSAELPLLARDTRSLSALAEGTGRNLDVVRVSVADVSGKNLAAFQAPSGQTTEQGAPRKAPLVVERAVFTESAGEEDREGTAFALDPGAEGVRRTAIGTVRVVVSAERTDARTRALQRQIGLAGLGLFALCALIGVTVVRVIHAPLRALVAATRRVSAGDLEARVTPSSADEIGELGEAFNRMAADLEIARAEVQAERAELERRVALRTEELQKAQETLVHSERLSAVGQLVAGVAHELNNPLTVILGYAGLLLEKRPDPAERRKLDLIAAEAERCKKIVQNLLTFARKQKAEKSRVDLGEVIRRTVSLREYQMRTENIKVELALASDLPAAFADFHQLQQVILNLLVNAEQAIHDAGKGSRIAIATRCIESQTRGSTPDRSIEIVVEDDGPGIPTANRARVFEPFFTTKEIGKGTGLGLSICYGIVADQGGTIRVESEPGAFTRFTIVLPALDGSQLAGAETAPPPVLAPSPRAVRRVLVIDDDPAVLQFVEDAFHGLPYKIETALGGRDGIARLSTGRLYDLVLSDMRMPDFDGSAVFRYVRQNRPELEPRLVFATGDIANPEALEFLQSSGRPVLEKPFSIYALREAADRVER